MLSSRQVSGSDKQLSYLWKYRRININLDTCLYTVILTHSHLQNLSRREHNRDRLQMGQYSSAEHADVHGRVCWKVRAEVECTEINVVATHVLGEIIDGAVGNLVGKYLNP